MMPLCGVRTRVVVTQTRPDSRETGTKGGLQGLGEVARVVGGGGWGWERWAETGLR